MDESFYFDQSKMPEYYRFNYYQTPKYFAPNNYIENINIERGSYYVYNKDVFAVMPIVCTK